MALLPAESLGFGDSDALNADFMKRLFYFIKLERLDDRLDLLHGFPPLRLWRARRRPPGRPLSGVGKARAMPARDAKARLSGGASKARKTDLFCTDSGQRCLGYVRAGAIRSLSSEPIPDSSHGFLDRGVARRIRESQIAFAIGSEAGAGDGGDTRSEEHT